MEKDYMFSHRVVVMDAAEYVARFRDVERFLAYCRECDSYGRVWSCPPFEGDVREKTDGFSQVTIWATVITFSDSVRDRVRDRAARERVTWEAIEAAWRVLLPFLYAQERRLEGCRVFTGRCRQCGAAVCSRVEGVPCRHPDRLRSSLEAVGFDLAGTMEQLFGLPLVWATDGRLPERVTLVTAMFSPGPLPAELPPAL